MGSYYWIQLLVSYSLLVVQTHQHCRHYMCLSTVHSQYRNLLAVYFFVLFSYHSLKNPILLFLSMHFHGHRLGGIVLPTYLQISWAEGLKNPRRIGSDSMRFVLALFVRLPALFQPTLHTIKGHRNALIKCGLVYNFTTVFLFRPIDSFVT